MVVPKRRARPPSDQGAKPARGVKPSFHPSSSPKKSSSPSKKTKTKRQKRHDYLVRRSIAGSSSSPTKPELSESPEAESDASSNVNEVRFEEPGKASTQRRRLSDLDSDSDGDQRGVIDVESSDEEVPVVKRKRVTKVLAVSDSEEEGVEVKKEEGAEAKKEEGVEVKKEEGAVVEVDGVVVKKEVEDRIKKEDGTEEGETVKQEEDIVDITSESEDEGDIRMSVRRAGKRKAVALSLTPTSEDEPDNQEWRSRGGRIVRHKRVEPEEGEESEEDMMDGLDEDVVLDSRLRSAPARNSRMMEMRENLAKLKRRKLGQEIAVQSSSESSESGNDDDRVQEIVQPRGRRVFKPIPGAQPTLEDWFSNTGDSDHDARPTSARRGTSSDSDGEDSDDRDSWIEDDGGEANVPILPEGYSMFGHQPLAHQFKVVMQMFVHLACTKPRKRWAFRHDEKNGNSGYMLSPHAKRLFTPDIEQYFGLALRALRRKLDGMRDSLVVSSAWTSSFKKALNSHTELNIFDLDFAPVVKNEDDSADDDQEDQTTPHDLGDLGRFCQARVRCYHNFVHWEWQLFETIKAEIQVLRTARWRNDPAQAERPAADDPDGIMAWLDRRGIVEQEWHQLEQLMEAARGLEFKKGNEDD
ncbi:hypothetical protein FRC06_002408 [Ceratobasidium sp. 370]|nr:hypothetical protein FRC06_002408 [Ceratobasidium sp. 370]